MPDGIRIPYSDEHPMRIKGEAWRIAALDFTKRPLSVGRLACNLPREVLRMIGGNDVRKAVHVVFDQCVSLLLCRLALTHLHGKDNIDLLPSHWRLCNVVKCLPKHAFIFLVIGKDDNVSTCFGF